MVLSEKVALSVGFWSRPGILEAELILSGGVL